MDVGVFSECIKNLIVGNDKVGVPGFGMFRAELMPAGFSDLRTIINPPYRRMYFEKVDVDRAEGDILFDYISSKLGVSAEQAEVELSWCLGRIRSELDGNKVCLLPGLGRMKATSQHDYFFVPDDGLDIYPEAFGLKPVCLRRAETSEAQPEPEPEPEPEVQPEPMQMSSAAPAAASPLPEINRTEVGPVMDVREIYGDVKPKQSKQPKQPKPVSPVEDPDAEPHSDVSFSLLRIILIILLLAIVAAVLLIVLPDEIVDRVLYTGEEYRIIHGLVL